MTGSAAAPYVLMSIVCPHCRQKQVVQVRARTGFSQMADQIVCCAECRQDFSVMVPDKIVGGPFFP
jgi:hypothetical protein